MQAPMILPWLAHKWGVGEDRTLALWNAACADADHAIGADRNSAYWAYAKARRIDLLDQEVMARYPATEMPWIMMRLNLLRLWAGLRMWFVGNGLVRAC